MRITIAVLLTLALAVGGCKDQKEVDELNKKNTELKNELAARDRFIEEVTSTINEIHDALEATWAKEKSVVRETTKPEGKAAQPPAQLKQQILARIADMHSTIVEGRKRIAALQRKLDEAGVQFAGLQRMVDDLKRDLDAREQSILQLQANVEALKGEIKLKTEVIAAREQTISDQTKELNTVYFITGTKDDLTQKGIIAKEGGFPWGLFGSTTVLAAHLNNKDFRTLDKTRDFSIELSGVIDQIVPKRDTAWFSIGTEEGGRSVLKIRDAEKFWRQTHLVIVVE